MNLRDLTDKQILKCQKDSNEKRKAWERLYGNNQMSEHEKKLWNYAYGKGFNAGLHVHV